MINICFVQIHTSRQTEGACTQGYPLLQYQWYSRTYKNNWCVHQLEYNKLRHHQILYWHPWFTLLLCFLWLWLKLFIRVITSQPTRLKYGTTHFSQALLYFHYTPVRTPWWLRPTRNHDQCIKYTTKTWKFKRLARNWSDHVRLHDHTQHTWGTHRYTG